MSYIRRRSQPKAGNHKLDGCIELEIMTRGYCEPGHAPITHRAPEDCDPGCPDNVEDFKVMLTSKDLPDLDITDYIDKDTIESLKDDLLEDHRDCFNYDNDMAYEASVGK